MMVLFYPNGSLTFSLLAIADLRSGGKGEISLSRQYWHSLDD
jgi:hypothetical protein